MVEMVCLDTSAPKTSASAPPLPLAHDPRGEAAVAVPRHVDLDGADVGEHRLGPLAVTAVPAVLAGRVVPVVAEVVGSARPPAHPPGPASSPGAAHRGRPGPGPARGPAPPTRAPAAYLQRFPPRRPRPSTSPSRRSSCHSLRCLP